DLLQLFDGGGDGLVDATLEIHRVHAGGDRLHAFADHRLREDRRGGGAVTGGVGSLGGDFLHHLRAHVLELVGELHFLRHGHAVLGDGGGAEALLEHDVAALGAQGCLDRVGQGVDAAHHAGTRVFGETDFFGCHGISSCKALLLIVIPAKAGIQRSFDLGPGLRRDDGYGVPRARSAFENRNEIVFAHDEQFLAIDLDLGTGILAEQHLVAGLDRHRADLAVFLDLAGAHGDHFALDRLFGRGVGDDDAAGGLGFRLEALDDDTVVQWTKLHGDSSCVGG